MLIATATTAQIRQVWQKKLYIKMKISLHLLLVIICTNYQLCALQTTFPVILTNQKFIESQMIAETFENRMMQEAWQGYLTEQRLQHYLQQGADINATNYCGDTALSHAAHTGHTDIVQMLIAQGADVNAKNKAGETALIAAINFFHLTTIQALIAANTDLEVTDKQGCTALMIASRRGNITFIQLLIAAGAHLNTRDNDGGTALMLASYFGHMDAVQELIAAGADSTLQNERSEDRTARDFAGNTNIHENLVEAYDASVTAGLVERRAYFARRVQARNMIQAEKQLFPSIADIIMEYSYSTSPIDLPALQTEHEEEEEKKEPATQSKYWEYCFVQ